jgi:hypothetical protein
MTKSLLPGLAFILVASCTERHKDLSTISIGSGQMPAFTAFRRDSIDLVFGKGDSLMYTASDKGSLSFSPPSLIDTLPNLVAYATRGPQICATQNGLAMIAVNKAGNIFSYVKDVSGNWVKTAIVNDIDTVNKEGFLGLAGNGTNNVFAIWTDLRNDRHNKLYGARSTDGGKTWQKNILVYASPDSNICECCKPSVVMQGDHVFVMFRNWLNGNRDMYLVQSSDGGMSFGEPMKLGTGNWQLDGCPMDGGGLAVDRAGFIQTVWRRQSDIYACEPGNAETKLGEGRSCVVAAFNHKNIYAWSSDGNIICLLPGGSKHIVGQGSLPVLQSINDKEVLCIWQDDKQIQGCLLPL